MNWHVLNIFIAGVAGGIGVVVGIWVASSLFGPFTVNFSTTRVVQKQEVEEGQS